MTTLTWVDLTPEQFDERKDRNKMLTNSLWSWNESAGSNGCMCQNVYVVLIQEGEVLDYDQQSNYPEHLRRKKEEWKRENLVQRDGKWFIRLQREPYWELPDDTRLEVMDGVEYVLSSDEVVETDTEILIAEPCDDYSNTPWSSDLEELPDGLYLILLQHHCFTTYHYEYGYEGDSEHEVALISSIPLDYKGIFDAGVLEKLSNE